MTDTFRQLDLGDDIILCLDLKSRRCSAAVFDDDDGSYDECGRPVTGYELFSGYIDSSLESDPCLYRACDHHSSVAGEIIAALVAHHERMLNGTV